MKFNIFFSLKGPAGIVENVPNTNNPIEIANIASLLKLVSKTFRQVGGLRLSG
jgi:hypothetical protein